MNYYYFYFHSNIISNSKEEIKLSLWNYELLLLLFPWKMNHISKGMFLFFSGNRNKLLISISNDNILIILISNEIVFTSLFP